MKTIIEGNGLRPTTYSLSDILSKPGIYRAEGYISTSDYCLVPRNIPNRQQVVLIVTHIGDVALADTEYLKTLRFVKANVAITFSD